MMIDVPVAPNLPVPMRHFPKKGMRTERPAIGERQDHRAQLRTVTHPIGGRRSPTTLLDFRARR
jgi:hypothetical protein